MAEKTKKREREEDGLLMRTVSQHHFQHAGNSQRLTISCSEVRSVCLFVFFGNGVSVVNSLEVSRDQKNSVRLCKRSMGFMCGHAALCWLSTFGNIVFGLLALGLSR